MSTSGPQRAAGPGEYVMTVQGPIAPDDLGFTLMHEHLLTRFWHATHRFDLAGMPEDPRYIVEELAATGELERKLSDALGEGYRETRDERVVQLAA